MSPPIISLACRRAWSIRNGKKRTHRSGASSFLRIRVFLFLIDIRRKTAQRVQRPPGAAYQEHALSPFLRTAGIFRRLLDGEQHAPAARVSVQIFQYRHLLSPRTYSNHQNSWQKLGGTKGAWPRCRPWRASARLRPPPCPARFVLPSFFVMNSEACYR